MFFLFLQKSLWFIDNWNYFVQYPSYSLLYLMPSKTHTSQSESVHEKTYHERMEAIVSRKQATLIAKTGLPTRILNLLWHRRDEKCSAEILAYIAFPYLSHEKHPDVRLGHFRQLLRSWLIPWWLRWSDLLEIKTAVQHPETLTEHTRITIMNLLDEKNKW